MASNNNCDLEILSTAVYSIKIKGILHRTTLEKLRSTIVSVEYDFANSISIVECLICNQSTLTQFKKNIYLDHLTILDIELV